MEHPECDPEEFISADTTNMIHALLLYKLIVKVLQPSEVNSVIDAGTDTIIEQLSIHMDPNAVSKITRDTAENMKDLINKMRTSVLPGE